MRGISTIVVIALLSACSPIPAKDDPWTSPDKFQHGAISAVIGVAATSAARADMNDCDAFRTGMSVTVGIGAAKEWIDQDIRHKGWSWRDLAWDVAGGTIGSLLASQCR